MLATTIGTRFRAIRIVGGVVIAADAARLLGISKVALHRIETDVSTPDRELIGAFSEAFEVSSDYVESGAVVGEREELAERVAGILASTSEDAAIDAAMASRLKTARVTAGFATAISAISTLGFKHATYLSHEAGGRRLPHERAILYAVNFRARPEYLLRGELPVLADGLDFISRWRPAHISFDFSAILERAPNWRWLKKSGSANSLVLPVLAADDGRIVLAEKDPMQVPRGLLPPKTPRVDGPAYGIRISAEEIWIVDPGSTNGEVVLVSADGFFRAALVRPGVGPDILAEPQLTGDQVALGLYVGRIVIPTE
jgi:transcriptional regulator with XRE-family HTH domain